MIGLITHYPWIGTGGYIYGLKLFPTAGAPGIP